MKNFAVALTILLSIPSGPVEAQGTIPATSQTDCLIAVAPAATLLLPYFEVDFRAEQSSAATTLFTVTNTSNIPQIARVTIWTDWGFPVMTFNILLTGYDVQSINLYDVFARGALPQTGLSISPRGIRSTPTGTASSNGTVATYDNPNFSPAAAASCANINPSLSGAMLADVQQAFTTGRYQMCGSLRVGTNDHGPMAVGYATVDVVNNCASTFPTDPSYFTSEILFDNVLIGDYQRVNPTATSGNYAGGDALVHIRAVPGGVPAGFPPFTPAPATTLPYTFYDRYTPENNPAIDRRQPLPALFAARFIQGGAGSFDTRISIWREGFLSGAETQSCVGLDVNARIPNEVQGTAQIVRFDERENPTVLALGCQIPTCFLRYETPIASAIPTSNTGQFPLPSGSGDVGGWFYFNLSNGGDDDYSRLNATGARPRSLASRNTSQNWVSVWMTAEGRYGVDMPAAQLGSGCSPNPGTTPVRGSAEQAAGQRLEAGAPGGAIGPQNPPAP